MAGGAINIQIGGNAQQLSQAAAQASASLAGLNNAANAAAAGVQRLPPAIAPAGRGLGNLGQNAASAAAGLGRIPPAAGPAAAGLNQTASAANTAAAALARARGGAVNGSVALNDFSRIVQDAPFGLVAIGNNITQLVTSFGDLRRNAGSTGAAFRSLFSSATGFGGIGLIISAITTAVTFASIGFGAWTRGMGGAKKAADDASESAKKLAESIKSVSVIAGEAAGSTQGQAAQVQSLANVITDTNNAYEIRKRALQELQQVNKAYFGELKLEDAATGALTAKVQEYTKAIVSQAVVKGFTDEISRLSTALFQQQQNTEKARIKFRQLEAEYTKTKALAQASAGYADQSAVLSRLEARVDGARQAFEEQRKVEEDAVTSKALLVGALQKANEEALKFADTTSAGSKANKKEEDALKQRIAALKELQSLTGLNTAQQIQLAQLEIQLANRDSIKAGFTADELQQQIDGIIEKAFPVKTFEFKLDKVAIVPKTVSLAPNINVGAAVLPNGIANNAFDGVIKAIQDNAAIKLSQLQISLAQGIQQTIVQGAIDGLFAVGNTLGEAIAGIFNGEGVGSALARGAESILGIVGGVLQQVGKEIIIASKLVVALKAALNGLFGPGGAQIGLGVGLLLVAAGAALKNIKLAGGTTPGFADGTTNFLGGAALVGERGPEIVTLPTGANVIPNNPFDQLGRITLISEIRGEDIYLSNRRVSGRRRRV